MSMSLRLGMRFPLKVASSQSRCSCKSSKLIARLYQTASLDGPLQEAENVHSIVNLAARVRELDSKGIKTEQQRIPTRLTSRSWADEARARASRGSNTSGTSMLNLDAKLERKLSEPKRMMDSFVELTLPFKSMPELLEKYIATSGGIRLGKVFEDLDNLAGDISYTHTLGGRPGPSDTINPIYIVTASVDRLDLVQPLRADRDYKLSGMVIYVGKSSMEVLVTVEEVAENQSGGEPLICLTGRFTMAARNAITGKSQKIPPLNLTSKEEEELFSFGQAHKRRKALEAQTSLQKVPPTVSEASLLHTLYLAEQENQSLESTVKISETALYNTSHMHPQQRNVHMNVFGGYLIRSSYELAWMAAALYANQPVNFLSLDALSFHLPVSIGTVLTLSSHVTYTKNHEDEEGKQQDQKSSAIASVVVVAEINEVATGLRKRSNTFHYSFDLGSNVTKRVTPESYAETLAWIEGKRRVELGQEVRKNYRR